MLVEFCEEIFPEPDYRFNIGDCVTSFSYPSPGTIIARENEKGISIYNIEHDDRSVTITDDNNLEPYTEPKPECTLKPFGRVIGRDNVDDEWNIDFFSHYIKDAVYPYVCLRHGWKQCIPYEGNEHLLGTTDSPTK